MNVPFLFRVIVIGIAVLAMVVTYFYTGRTDTVVDKVAEEVIKYETGSGFDLNALKVEKA